MAAVEQHARFKYWSDRKDYEQQEQPKAKDDFGMALVININD